jgi:hypothetical protein
MATNYEVFNLQIAICVYLGKKAHQIDWATEIVIDIETQTILAWNVTEKPQPTIEQLELAWENDRLTYYRNLQKGKIKAQYKYLMENGIGGCTTSVIQNGNNIVVDARRGGVENDQQNFKEALGYVIRKSTASFTGLVTGLTTKVKIMAGEVGTCGNVTLTADSTKTVKELILEHNAVTGAVQLYLAFGNGSQIPTANIVLTGGLDGLTITVRDYFNNYLTLDILELTHVVEDLVDYGFYIMNTKWTKDVAIDACTTVAEILAISM